MQIKFNKSLGYEGRTFEAGEIIDTEDKSLISVAKDKGTDIIVVYKPEPESKSKSISKKSTGKEEDK